MEPPFTFIEKEVEVMVGNAIGKDRRGQESFLSSSVREYRGCEFNP